MRNWCFWTAVFEKTLESPLDCKEIKPVNPKVNQSWTTDWKDWCWSWSSNSFGYLMWRADSFEKTLMLGKTEGRRRGDGRRQDGWMASLTQWAWVWTSSKRRWRTGKPGVLQAMASQRVQHAEQLDNNKEKNNCEFNGKIKYNSSTLNM